MLSQTVMWTVDSAMVGRVGKAELAAVGLGGLLVWTLYSFFVGFSYSVNTYVAQSFGARKFDLCGRYLWQGMYLALVAGAAILCLRHFNPQTVRLLGPEPAVQEPCLAYASIRMLGGPFFILQYTFSNFLRGIGNTRTPMKVMIVANAINLVLDFFLIFGYGPFPAMGVEGAAWATFIAVVASVVIFVFVVFNAGYRERYGTYRERRPRRKETADLVRVGTPIAIHYFLDIGTFLVFSGYIARMGTEPLAANHITIQILALSFMPVNGFAIAATTLVGQYLGTGAPPLARRSAYNTLRLGLLYAGFIAVLYLAIPGPLIRIFNSDAMVLYYGKRIILFAALFQIFDTIQMIASGALRGAGDTRTPMLMAVGSGWLIFLPLAYLFGTVAGGGVIGAWGGATVYVVVLGVAMLLRLKLGGWASARLVGHEKREMGTVG